MIDRWDYDDIVSGKVVFMTRTVCIIVRDNKIPFELSVKRYYTIEEVAGDNWREGLDDIEDEWE